MRSFSRALIPLAAAALAAAVWFGPMEHQGTWQDGQIVDTPTYLRYADDVADGNLPYRDVQVEYPPLAFAVILPPRLAGSSYESYTSAFSALMVELAAPGALAVKGLRWQRAVVRFGRREGTLKWLRGDD